MKLNKKISHDDEANLRELIIKLWKKKVFIFFMSLTFMAVGIIYGSLQTKIYKTSITIREAPYSSFDEYRLILSYEDLNFFSTKQPNQQQLTFQIVEQFNNEFKSQLLSIDTTVEFVEQNTELEYLKSFLSKKKISIQEYFENKLKNERNSKNVYSLVYSEPFQEKEFLNNYIIFVKKKTEKIFKQQLSDTLTSKIKLYKYNLELVEKTNFENLMQPRSSKKLSDISKDEMLLNILVLEKMLNETKNLKLKYDPILTKASSPIEISITWRSYLLFGFVFGFLLSLFIIFLNKDY